MQRWIPILFLAAAGSLAAQGTDTLGADFKLEGKAYGDDCAFAIKNPKANPDGSPGGTVQSCAQELFTGNPLHLTAGSLAPQNGVGFGPAFAFDPDLTNWRLNINSDAVVSTNGSWRAGLYIKAAKTPTKPSTVVVLTQRPTHPLKPTPPAPAPELNFYAQGISLHQLGYYGIGNATSRSAEALYQMREVVIGANGLLPFGNSGFGLFAEANGRSVDIRPDTGNAIPAIGQFYTNLSAPGLAYQPVFAQLGQGARFDRTFANRLTLDYSATIQEFVAGSSSFNRLTLDFAHTIILDRTETHAASPTPPHASGPDGGADVSKPNYHTKDHEGSVNFGVTVVQSFVPTGNAVPFYLQPTLGGTDINGNSSLPSYPDYRFRAPNLLLFHASIEHSIWGPFGAEFLSQAGMVAQNRGDLAVAHLHHSFAAGLTIHAGGFPEVAILFAWGGHEGTHTTAYISPGLLGGSGRPSLF